MPRIRSYKPEMLADEKLAPLPVDVRFVFFALILIADDAGRLVDNVKLLDGQIYPETDDTCRDALAQLATLGRIIRYTAESGQRVLQVANWARHQRVDKPSRYVLPGPNEAADRERAVTGSVSPARASRDSREDVATLSRDARAPTLDPDLGPKTLDLGPSAGESEGGAAPQTPSEPAGNGTAGGKGQGYVKQGGWEQQGDRILGLDAWGDTPYERRRELLREVMDRRTASPASKTVWGAIAYVLAAHEPDPRPGTEHQAVKAKTPVVGGIEATSGTARGLSAAKSALTPIAAVLPKAAPLSAARILAEVPP